MKTIHQVETISVPRGVKVEVHCRQVRVTGPRGVIKKSFSHIPVDLTRKGRKVTIAYWSGNRRQCALVRTVYTKINNMIQGVTKGFQYKMRAAYAHFPIMMVVSDDKKTVEVRNFLGEKRARIINLPEGVTAYRSTGVKDEIVLEGIDNELVGMS
eukprot:MONOS_13337.1-p1 / transcript=MONOS_13337.1 / gene=MONOS_13337 / organism=Monocercomonoides_exilis_PA203 / gene_product=60S ribosomal protein L9-1, incomplete / transcript_product=60S ribosomal protein L9-1, incomplete / location=Mono_scaffold00812:189-777(-) / protein_length=154 / sequence_SO=supercontig / SO=protein_coding / is_pseudo=false